MKRLTKRVYHKEENYSTIEFQNVEPHELGKIKERLCEYEEIGITPEQLRQFADDSWQFQMQNEYMALRDSSNKALSCLHKVEKHARDLAKQNAELRAKLAEYENAEEQKLLADVSKMKCLNCLYRSQYCDSENRYGCGGLHGTEFYVRANYFCAEFEPRITKSEALQALKERE